VAWIELIAVIVLAVSGSLLGHCVGRSRRWWLGFALPMIVIALVILGHRSVALSFVAPISWVVEARANPLLMSLAVTMMLVTLLVRLPEHRKRVALGAMTAAMVAYNGVIPVLAPIVVRGALGATPTRIDSHGVCRQTHGYTCGPASAVTCLRSLGVEADEGQLAIESRCGPVVGTDGQLMARAIESLYGQWGVRCAYLRMGSLDALQTPAVANMNLPRIGGHYVAVLEVHSSGVVVGDPLRGQYGMSRSDFLAAWQNAAVVFTRN
jgi:hypothetical protein